ncbi:MAG: hypothetical protein ACE5I7_14570 [Candidatus Binatia bacterium]
MDDPQFDQAVRTFAAARRYRPATVHRWLRLPAADRGALLGLAQELHFSENQLRDVWDWAEDIAQRDRLSLAQVLALEAITAARRRPAGRSDKVKHIKTALRRLRFPQLTAVEDRLAVLVRALALPRNVRVVFPESLEGDEVRVEIVARNAAALREAAARLQAAVQEPACEAIFELLGEAP